jgi:hypothetical protein
LSADDVKAAFPELTRKVTRLKLAELLDRGEFKKAAALKEELDGPLPRGRVVTLFSGRRLNILLGRFEKTLC